MKILPIVVSTMLLVACATQSYSDDAAISASIEKALSPYCDQNKILGAQGSRVGGKMYMKVTCMDRDGNTIHRLLFRVFSDGTLYPYPEIHVVN